MSAAANKQKILEVATKLFSTQGLKDTNIRQIATEAKANSALIFYYFGCKEKLFFECLKELASERFAVISEILTPPADKRDFELKLQLFAQSMHSVFQHKKDLVKILHREIDNENPKAVKVFEEHMQPVCNMLQTFFAQAHKKKILRKDLDPKFITHDFFAMMSNPIRNEAFMKIIFKSELAKTGWPQFYKDNQERVISLFLKGALADEND